MTMCTKAATVKQVRTKSSNAKVDKKNKNVVYLHLKKGEYRPKYDFIKV